MLVRPVLSFLLTLMLYLQEAEQWLTHSLLDRKLDLYLESFFAWWNLFHQVEEIRTVEDERKGMEVK